MHIPDGYLPIGVTLSGYAVAGLLTWYSLKKINNKYPKELKANEQRKDPRGEIPKASLLTAAFIVASLIHIPVPPTTVHLMLSGLMGMLLGYYAVPAILIGITLQAIMFHHGGITTIGINTINFAIPALLSYFLFSNLIRKIKLNTKSLSLIGFTAGIFGSALSVLMFTLILVIFIPTELSVIQEKQAIFTLSLAHIPVILIEGVFSALLLAYLYKTKPKIIEDMWHYEIR